MKIGVRYVEAYCKSWGRTASLSARVVSILKCGAEMYLFRAERSMTGLHLPPGLGTTNNRL